VRVGDFPLGCGNSLTVFGRRFEGIVLPVCRMQWSTRHDEGLLARLGQGIPIWGNEDQRVKPQLASGESAVTTIRSAPVAAGA
jgi:hypothetical protein